MIPVTTDRKNIIEVKRSDSLAIFAVMPIKVVIIDGKFDCVVICSWHKRR